MLYGFLSGKWVKLFLSNFVFIYRFTLGYLRSNLGFVPALCIVELYVVNNVLLVTSVSLKAH